MKALSAAFCVTLVLLLAGTAVAKDWVHQITVSGPSLEDPIEISDPQVLDRFNPWGGLFRFLAERLEEKGVDRQTLEGPYEVRFSLEELEWTYAFSYYPLEGFDSGYIVLPDPPNDQGIVHPAGWYSSTDDWNDVMSEQLDGAPTSTGHGEPRIGGLMGQLFIALSALALLGLVIAVRSPRHL